MNFGEENIGAAAALTPKAIPYRATKQDFETKIVGWVTLGLGVLFLRGCSQIILFPFGMKKRIVKNVNCPSFFFFSNEVIHCFAEKIFWTRPWILECYSLLKMYYGVSKDD